MKSLILNKPPQPTILMQSAASAVIEKREPQSLTLTVTLKQGNKDSSFVVPAAAILKSAESVPAPQKQ